MISSSFLYSQIREESGDDEREEGEERAGFDKSGSEGRARFRLGVREQAAFLWSSDLEQILQESLTHAFNL